MEAYAGPPASFVYEKIQYKPNAKIHFVGRSMGAVIVRSYLGLMEGGIAASRKGRVVLLAPPNRGSHVASTMPRRLGQLAQAVSDLSEAPSSYVSSFHPPLLWEFGVNWIKSDHLVRTSSAPLPSAFDAVEVPGLHTTILCRKSTVLLVSTFLETGASASTSVSWGE